MKLWLANTSGLDHATLHVHIGMLIWIVGVAVAGDVSSVWPLVVVIVAELVNEVFDRIRVDHGGSPIRHRISSTRCYGRWCCSR